VQNDLHSPNNGTRISGGSEKAARDDCASDQNERRNRQATNAWGQGAETVPELKTA